MRTAAEQAGRGANRLAVSVLSHTANRIADERAALLRQAELKKDTLHDFDHFSANSGVGLSGKVTSILVADGPAARAPLRNTSVWRAARDKLLADPQTVVEIS